MTHLKFTFYILLFVLASCIDNNDKGKKNSRANRNGYEIRDLQEIKDDGKLRVLVAYSNTSYFLYKGEPMGFEYELLKRFADHLGVELEIKISGNIDSLLYNLNEGDVDLVAHGLTITSGRDSLVTFTDYLYLTHQVLVQKKPDNWRTMKWSSLEASLIHDAIELIGDTVSLRKNSAYYERLINLSQEIGGEIYLDTIPGDLSTDEIIKMVVDGEIKYTFADDNIASINKSYYPVLNIEVPVSFSQRIAWAVNDESKELLKAMNSWIKSMKKETDYYVIYNKYFKNTRSFRKRIQSDFYSLTNDRISKYDPIIKKYADKLNWDWRLLASQIYQESKFDPSAKSWVDAKGLMQLMPSTAKELGVKNRLDPEQSIRGGTKYLEKLWNRFDEVEDSVQRIKFTLASFNCGYGHVRDAQRLAEQKQINHLIWDDHVDKMILLLSHPKNYNSSVVRFGYVRGIEPFTYVEQIFERYGHYKKFIQQQS